MNDQAKGQGVRVAADALRCFISRAFTGKGMSGADAATIAEVIVWANLRGIDSHGVMRLPMYLGLIDRSAMDPKARIKVISDRGATVLADAQRAAGQISLGHVTNLAIAKARVHGIAMGLVTNTTHTGTAGYFAQKAAEQGCIGIVTTATVPLMAYHGARVASLGTSPIAMAVPRAGHRPIVFDMATSTGSNGKLKQAQLEKKPIPADWALTADGEPTTDPDKAAVLLPLGGAKGSGLALMIEYLNSVLAAAPILQPMAGIFTGTRHTQNASIIAIDIEAFRPLGAFAADSEELASTLAGLPRAEGFDQIRLPGERGDRIEAERGANGIPLSAALKASLDKVAQECGIDPI